MMSACREGRTSLDDTCMAAIDPQRTLASAVETLRNLAFGPLGGQGFLLVDFCAFLVRCSSRCVRESRIISRQTTSST